VTESRRRSFPLRTFFSEMAGTALLLLVGLSIVIVMFGEGTPVARIIPGEAARRAVTGFLFGLTGAAIALSPLGKASGAHINPVVSLGFWFAGKLRPGILAVYLSAQLTGAILGCLPLLLWGPFGRSVIYGATVPGEGFGPAGAFAGEVVTTFTMITLLSVFLAFRNLRRFTPLLFPPLYSVMVAVEAPVSGTSTNPARSLGPAIVSGRWDAWWIYWVGPLLGAFLALVVCRALARRVEVAKLYHFDTDPDRLRPVRRAREASPPVAPE
jgi:aquaporin Z